MINYQTLITLILNEECSHHQLYTVYYYLCHYFARLAINWTMNNREGGVQVLCQYQIIFFCRKKSVTFKSDNLTLCSHLNIIIQMCGYLSHLWIWIFVKFSAVLTIIQQRKMITINIVVSAEFNIVTSLTRNWKRNGKGNWEKNKI